MAGSILDALKKAKLVDPKLTEQIEASKRDELAYIERASVRNASSRVSDDHANKEQQDRFYKKAAKETTKAAGRVGTKDYFNRFK